MSTTEDIDVAYKYSGGLGVKGTIFQIQFDIACRAADIQFLSQYPAEKEWLCPPCTSLTFEVDSVKQSPDGFKRLVGVRASIQPKVPGADQIESCQDTPRSVITNPAKGFSWKGNEEAQRVGEEEMVLAQQDGQGTGMGRKKKQRPSQLTALEQEMWPCIADGCTNQTRNADQHCFQHRPVLQGTFCGNFLNNQHPTTIALKHVTTLNLFIFAIHDDTSTKVVGITSSGERVGGRFVDGFIELTSLSTSDAWDSAEGTDVEAGGYL
jgi:hypothetical protein